MREIEKMKNYLKNYRNIENFYFEGLKEKTLNEKYLYLKNHFNYYIMNSWNGLETIANNVKIYNLGLTNEQENNFFEIVNIDPYFFDYVNNPIIEEFEEITETKIFFNGRSSGYIILCNENSNKHIFGDYEDFFDCENYLQFRKNTNYYEYRNENNTKKYEIDLLYYLVKCFDKLCDILRSDLIYTVDNYEIEAETITETKEIKTIVLN